MAKIRLTRTIVTEYEPNINFYPKGCNFEDMAKIDGMSDDLESVFTNLESDEVEYEIIEDNRVIARGNCNDI